jgi:hypothetical protein
MTVLRAQRVSSTCVLQCIARWVCSREPVHGLLYLPHSSSVYMACCICHIPAAVSLYMACCISHIPAAYTWPAVSLTFQQRIHGLLYLSHSSSLYMACCISHSSSVYMACCISHIPAAYTWSAVSLTFQQPIHGLLYLSHSSSLYMVCCISHIPAAYTWPAVSHIPATYTWPAISLTFQQRIHGPLYLSHSSNREPLHGLLYLSHSCSLYLVWLSLKFQWHDRITYFTVWTLEGVWDSGGVATLIHNFGIIRKWGRGQLHASVAVHLRKSPVQTGSIMMQRLRGVCRDGVTANWSIGACSYCVLILLSRHLFVVTVVLCLVSLSWTSLEDAGRGVVFKPLSNYTPYFQFAVTWRGSGMRYYPKLQQCFEASHSCFSWEYAVAQLVEALRCKVAGPIPDGVIEIFRSPNLSSHSVSGVDSASNINEYQESFLG